MFIYCNFTLKKYTQYNKSELVCANIGAYVNDLQLTYMYITFIQMNTCTCSYYSIVNEKETSITNNNVLQLFQAKKNESMTFNI